jgi:hypothetical protein
VFAELDQCIRHRRFSAPQVWPELIIEPKKRPSTNGAGSVPGNMMPGSLPPSSSVTGKTPLAATDMTFLPVATDPVNTILSMPE